MCYFNICIDQKKSIKSRTYLFNLVVRRVPLDSDCNCADSSRLFCYFFSAGSFAPSQVVDDSFWAPNPSELCIFWSRNTRSEIIVWHTPYLECEAPEWNAYSWQNGLSKIMMNCSALSARWLSTSANEGKHQRRKKMKNYYECGKDNKQTCDWPIGIAKVIDGVSAILEDILIGIFALTVNRLWIDSARWHTRVFYSS